MRKHRREYITRLNETLTETYLAYDAREAMEQLSEHTHWDLRLEAGGIYSGMRYGDWDAHHTLLAVDIYRAHYIGKRVKLVPSIEFGKRLWMVTSP